MEVDKIYCMSSFLMYRTVIDRNKSFDKNHVPKFFTKDYICEPIHNSEELRASLKRQVEEATADGKAALALSGGIDSAILAKYMPKGSKAYTFKCVVPGVEVIDESIQAAKYAKECGLEHEVIEIYWEDMERYAPILMKHKGSPMHSIEVQIYKAALKAKEDGFTKFIFGETADVKYGGLNGLLSRDWTMKEYIDRFSYLLPDKVLTEWCYDLSPFYDCLKENGEINVHKHLCKWSIIESLSSYTNACAVADIEFVAPFSKTFLNVPLDINRIRRGENKYLVREIFEKEYQDWKIPTKIPMPRPTNEWFENWTGPTRKEFKKDCVHALTGDQKWLVWCLEQYLNLIEA